MAESHSAIGASSMYRWSNCPGSVRLSKGIKSISSKYAEEGTRAHEFGARWLEDGLDSLSKEYIPQEMNEALQLYVQTVRNDAGPSKILVEVKFALTEIHKDAFGTADAVVYDEASKILRVYDFKYGKGIEVEVENNQQLMYYGLGALLSTGYAVKEVELVIVQPRCNSEDGPIRRWRFKSSEIIDFAADLEKAAKATDDPKAPLNSGDHCRFCPASGICPELSEKALQLAQTQFSPVTVYDPIKLSETLTKLEMLESYAKSVREFAYNEASQGRCPPGFKLVEKRPVRKWILDEDVIGSRLNLLGVDDAFDRSLKSPAQIEKLLDKKSKHELNSMIAFVSSGTTLVPLTDKRPMVTLESQANQLFKPINPINELT